MPDFTLEDELRTLPWGVRIELSHEEVIPSNLAGFQHVQTPDTNFRIPRVRRALFIYLRRGNFETCVKSWKTLKLPRVQFHSCKHFGSEEWKGDTIHYSHFF